ncbi:MAG: hypothetical protein K0R92_563 [Lachnospiraceae bacterium]|nr:hypothetical protein [Lachnospiraceae bacterium]
MRIAFNEEYDFYQMKSALEGIGTNMHITITGNLGSGKSTVCKILEDKYGFEIYSTGKVQRELARELNISTLEMNQLMMSDPKYDTMIDDTTAKISRENRDKNIIFDSRLAWHFVEQSFKVFLSVSLDIAAERVMNDNRGKEEKYATVKEARELLAARAATEDKRYHAMYQLDYFNFSNYNLIIDSSCTSTEIIASIIISEAKKFHEAIKGQTYQSGNQGINRVLLAPSRLLPEEIDSEDLARCHDLAEQFKKIKDYVDDSVIVQRAGDDFTIIEGQDTVLAAKIAKVPYVSIIIKN